MAHMIGPWRNTSGKCWIEELENRSGKRKECLSTPTSTRWLPDPLLHKLWGFVVPFKFGSFLWFLLPPFPPHTRLCDTLSCIHYFFDIFIALFFFLWDFEILYRISEVLCYNYLSPPIKYSAWEIPFSPLDDQVDVCLLAIIATQILVTIRLDF